MSDVLDKRAAKILRDTYWSPAGWRREHDRTISASDFEYARSQGLMFDPVVMDHGQAILQLRTLIAALDRRVVVDAFLASLSTRRLDWRSALGSYAVFQHLNEHRYEGVGHRCRTCGLYDGDPVHDFNVLNFERLKWGGVRHESVVYAVMDLGLFNEMHVRSPTSDDLSIFRSIVEAIRKADVKTTAAALQARLPESLRSNKNERDILVSILGFCDVLADQAHPGFSDAFIPVDQRRLPDRHFVDMAYPACWWNRGVGINEARLEEYFGHAL